MTIQEKKSTEKDESDRAPRQSGDVVSFESASYPHVHARKERKFERVKSAFKAVSDEVFGGTTSKGDRKAKKRKKKNKKR